MIELRVVESSDGEALHMIFTEPGVRRFLFDDQVLTREQSQRHVDAAADHDAWVICENGEVIGFVSLRPKDDTRELVIAVSERHWGRGVALEAAQVAMRHGFDALRLERILAIVDLPNERSHWLMAQLGFVSTGEGQGPAYRFRRYEALSHLVSSP
jgi:[ribosomal protein S5]-alanine N-acetyltransferase